MWGNGIGREFGIDVLDGVPAIRLNCFGIRPIYETVMVNGKTRHRYDLRDGGWHHIAISYADPGNGEFDAQSTKLYINGSLINTQFVTCESSSNRRMQTAVTTLFIGRHVHDRRSSFKGLISDVRLWNRELAPAEVLALSQRTLETARNNNGLVLSLPLDNFTGTGLASTGTWTGAGAMHAGYMGQTDLVQSTLVDQTTYHSFCMIDDDGDGLHELWESEVALDVPDRVGGDAFEARARTWDKVSDDMFVPSQTGFFKVVGRDPESVIANFAVGKGIADKDDLSQKAQSKPLATTRSNTQPELCAIDTKPLTVPRVCQNRFKEAYVAIDGYIKGLHGRLDILNASWVRGETSETAFTLPNLPLNMTATWYPDYGILKFASGEAVEDKYWQRAMAMTLYRPSGRSSDSTVSFSFGVGGLPLFRDEKYRFFRFVHQTGEGGEQNAINYDTAVSTARSREDACGMQSYLATIVTEEEHDHLEKTMMIRETPGWQSGYIGGRVTEYDTFRWVTGPAAERSAFWFGLGTEGLPYLADNDNPHLHSNNERGDMAGRRFFEFDPKPDFGGNRRRVLVQPTRNDQSFLFTNWAGGKEYSAEDPEDYYCDTGDPNIPANWCQPASATPGDGVAIYGHKNREGTWFSVPSEAQKCDATQEHSICGYYVEYEEPAGETPVRFAHQVTLDMDQFRDFCQMADQPSG